MTSYRCFRASVSIRVTRVQPKSKYRFTLYIDRAHIKPVSIETLLRQFTCTTGGIFNPSFLIATNSYVYNSPFLKNLPSKGKFGKNPLCIVKQPFKKLMYTKSGQ